MLPPVIGSKFKNGSGSKDDRFHQLNPKYFRNNDYNIKNDQFCIISLIIPDASYKWQPPSKSFRLYNLNNDQIKVNMIGFSFVLMAGYDQESSYVSSMFKKRMIKKTMVAQ